jgi:hypothetical protein
MRERERRIIVLPGGKKELLTVQERKYKSYSYGRHKIYLTRQMRNVNVVFIFISQLIM